MFYNSGDNYYSEFIINSPAYGIPISADSLPTATANVNGIDDNLFVLQVTNINTGRYIVSGVVPSYNINDIVIVSISATVETITSIGVIDTFKILPNPPNTLEIDQYLTSSHGAGDWKTLSLSGSNAVTINIYDQTSASPISNVNISILNSDETLLVNTGVTNVNGLSRFALNDNTYKIRLNKAMVNFTVPETLIVSGNTSGTYYGTVITPTTSSVDLQTIYGTIVNPDGSYAVGVNINATIQPESELSTSAFLLTKQITNSITNSVGYFEIQLIKSFQFNIIGRLYGKEFFNKTITVDNDSTKNIVNY